MEATTGAAEAIPYIWDLPPLFNQASLFLRALNLHWLTMSRSHTSLQTACMMPVAHLNPRKSRELLRLIMCNLVAAAIAKTSDHLQPQARITSTVPFT